MWEKYQTTWQYLSQLQIWENGKCRWQYFRSRYSFCGFAWFRSDLLQTIWKGRIVLHNICNRHLCTDYTGHHCLCPRSFSYIQDGKAENKEEVKYGYRNQKKESFQGELGSSYNPANLCTHPRHIILFHKEWRDYDNWKGIGEVKQLVMLNNFRGYEWKGAILTETIIRNKGGEA